MYINDYKIKIKSKYNFQKSGFREPCKTVAEVGVLRRSPSIDEFWHETCGVRMVKRRWRSLNAADAVREILRTHKPLPIDPDRLNAMDNLMSEAKKSLE